MTLVVVATESGCRVFGDSGECETELAGHQVGAMTSEADAACLAVVDQREIWRRDVEGAWVRVASTEISLQSILSVHGTIFAGGMDEAVMLRIRADGSAERLQSFDHVSGRDEWFAGGPPLGVRSLCVVKAASNADGSVILAAVHVGGIPRSSDGGESWTPTVPIMFDVHEVRAHPYVPGFVAAAAAVGLCISHDAGRKWNVITEGLEQTNSLAVAVLDGEVLFSIQDGPFAKQSQVWRWRIGDKHVGQVRDGLPEWLDGKVDTGCIATDLTAAGLTATGGGRAALLDAGGNLWLSESGSHGWLRIATGLPYALGMIVLAV